jgi:hypothetical protein
MTIKEYISQKLPSISLTEAQFADVQVDFGLDTNQEYSASNSLAVNKAIVGIIEEQVLAPKLRSVSEGGMSLSWNYEDLGKLYMYLCKKYGLTPNPEVVSLLGVSMIRDVSSKW